MNKRPSLFFLLLFTLTCFHLQAQNWRLFNSGRTYSYGRCVMLRLDSVRASGSDSLLYPYKTTKVLDESLSSGGCQADYVAPHPFGDVIVEKPGGVYQLQYGSTDTIFINTQSNVPWRMFNYHDGGRLEAVPGPVYWDSGTTFAGPDSMRSIQLTVYDSTGATFGAPKNILISKGMGLVSGTHFNWLTMDESDYSNSWELPYIYPLAGITSPALGHGFPTVADFFTMQVGDTIQVVEDFYEDHSYTGYTFREQDVYLNRYYSASMDTLFLEADRWVLLTWRSGFTYLNSWRDTITDTIALTQAPWARLNDLLEEYIPSNPGLSDAAAEVFVDFGEPRHWTFSSGMPTRVWKPVQPGTTYNAIDTCFYYDPSTGFVNSSHYGAPLSTYCIEGLGGLYWYYDYWPPDWGNFYRLPTYYNLGGSTWGTPVEMILLSADPPQETFSFQLFPNPTSESVNLMIPTATSGDYAIEIMDVTGKTIRLFPSAKGSTTLDLTGIPAGLYFIKVQDTGGRLATQKLVVH